MTEFSWVMLIMTFGAGIFGASIGGLATFIITGVLVCKTTNISSWEYGKTATFQMLVPFVLACIVYAAYGLFFA